VPEWPLSHPALRYNDVAMTARFFYLKNNGRSVPETTDEQSNILILTIYIYFIFRTTDLFHQKRQISCLDNPLLKLEAVTPLFEPAQFTTI
jgi:hypothetical protein